MTIVTKDGRELYPRLIGSIENPEVTEYITCQEAGDDPERDLFGEIALFKIHVSEIQGFKGSYSIAPLAQQTKTN